MDGAMVERGTRLARRGWRRKGPNEGGGWRESFEIELEWGLDVVAGTKRMRR